MINYRISFFVFGDFFSGSTISFDEYITHEGYFLLIINFHLGLKLLTILKNWMTVSLSI